MVRSRRPSPQTEAVLSALRAEPLTWRYGYELASELGLKSGSLYPILIRLADRGLLETAWETAAPAGRPHRHLYRLSRSGVALADAVCEEQADKERRAPASRRVSRLREA
jgi:DNA-binding PadR family transcriptional regulator